MNEPLSVRFVVQLSASEVRRIEDYAHAKRMFGRSEACRQILAAGFEALGIATPADQHDTRGAPIAIESVEAPTIPTPEACGRPTLGELILPWLREQGRRSYTQAEVAQGVFGIEGAQQIGREAAVANVFKAIGWKARSSRRDGVTTRTFFAPE